MANEETSTGDSYTVKIDGREERVSLNELQKHLYSIKELPNAIPYLTSYYGKNWGFCIQDNIRKKLKPGKYRVLIDSKHFNGSMTISDKVLKGKSKKRGWGRFI